MKIKMKSIRKPDWIRGAGIKRNDELKGGIPLTAMWGIVTSANSEHNTVTVDLENGMPLRDIPVRSLEWAGVGTEGYGERDLPPKDCVVLIIFPGGDIENGFVLCSALNRFEAKHKTELLVSGKEKEHLRVREGKKTTLKINGATVIVNIDGSIKITPATGKDIELAGGTMGANDLTNCIFSGALHCTDVLKKVKVP